jgi:hypothetical protein
VNLKLHIKVLRSHQVFFRLTAVFNQVAQENPFEGLGAQLSNPPPTTRVVLNSRLTFLAPQSGQTIDLSLLLKMSISKSLPHFSH